MFGELVNAKSVASLIVARVVYTTNFYNVAAIFSFIALDFHQNVAGLGLLGAGFMVGVGLFQVPGGIIAAKFGPRQAAIYGTGLYSLATLFEALSPSLFVLIILRFVVGVCMAIVSSPGVVLITTYYKRGEEGLAVGIHNSTFWIGGILGLSAWTIITQFAGWRLSLAFGGALGLGTMILLRSYLPNEKMANAFRVVRGDLRTVLLDRRLILIGLGLLGISVGASLVATFGVYYAEVELGLSPAWAGIITSLTGVAGVVFSPISGRVYDRLPNVRLLFLVSAVTTSVALVIIYSGTTLALGVSASLVGAAIGLAGTVGFAAAREENKAGERYRSLSVSWVNGISLFGTFWAPIVFSSFVLEFGYGLAWSISGLFPLLLVLPLLVLLRAEARLNH